MRAPPVTVIMPTLGSPERAALLRRALGTVVGQEGVETRPIVVVNGPERSPALLAELRARQDVVTVELEEANLPLALQVGRTHVETPWFAELDDDDELLPGALATRVGALAERPEFGAVVTNGLRREGGATTLHLADIAPIEQDPLMALTQKNWLLPGSWLCRTDTVPADLLEGMPRHLECTFLAIRLATHTRVRFLREPTVVYNSDTPQSNSTSLQYVIGQDAALRRILELDLPPGVRRQFELRLARACHGAARALARSGDRRAAWRWHARALLQPHGWRLLLHTAKLLHPCLAA